MSWSCPIPVKFVRSIQVTPWVLCWPHWQARLLMPRNLPLYSLLQDKYKQQSGLVRISEYIYSMCKIEIELQTKALNVFCHINPKLLTHIKTNHRILLKYSLAKVGTKSIAKVHWNLIFNIFFISGLPRGTCFHEVYSFYSEYDPVTILPDSWNHQVSI